MSTIVPSADVASTGASWFKNPAANYWDNVNEPGTADDSSYNDAGADGTFECSCTTMPTALAVMGITVTQRVKFLGAATAQQTRVYLRIGGTQYNGSWVSIIGASTETNFTYTWSVNPSTGVPFTPAEINALIIGWEYGNSLVESARITQLKADVSYTPLPPDQGATRDAASRKLFLRRMPQQFPELSGGLWLLDLAHHTQVDLFHLFGISESGQGWERDRWKRGLMTIKDVTVDPMSNVVTLRFRNDRRIRCLMYDSGWAKQGGAAKNGLMRFTNGATWTFTRASAATFTDVSGDSVTVHPEAVRSTAATTATTPGPGPGARSSSPLALRSPPTGTPRPWWPSTARCPTSTTTRTTTPGCTSTAPTPVGSTRRRLPARPTAP
jgi:hypothetical protein